MFRKLCRYMSVPMKWNLRTTVLRRTIDCTAETSRVTTVDSCFILVRTRQQWDICNASPRANAHISQNVPSLYQVPYFKLTCALKYALPYHLFRDARRQAKCHDWCLEVLEKQKLINVAGQGQLKHLIAWSAPCFKNEAYWDRKRPTVRRYINDKPETAPDRIRSQ